MGDFEKTRELFHLPPGVIYLDGNSLGPLPISALARMEQTLRAEWGDMAIAGWNRAGWFDLPRRQGDRIARLIGASSGHVVLGDTLSIKVYQALASALELAPDRHVILSDTGNFPSDLYMAQGLARTLGGNYRLKTVPPEAVEEALSEDVAVLMLTEVDYRTGRKHDMKALTDAAHAKGIVTVWDLAHSAGALPVDLEGTGADFAVGCTYKYLNSGPGGPAFIYVAPRHAETAHPALSGWLGHETPFAFEADYRPGHGIDRMRVGTPPILQMAALDASLDIWDNVDMQALRARSIALCDRFILGIETTCPMLRLVSPRDGHARGSQVSFAFDHGYEAMQACIASGVIGDFRAPDIMRFGFTPLYINEKDVDEAIGIIADVMARELWKQPRFQTRSPVT